MDIQIGDFRNNVKVNKSVTLRKMFGDSDKIQTSKWKFDLENLYPSP